MPNKEEEQQIGGPGTAFTKVIGHFWDRTRQEREEGKEPGTFVIKRTVVDQGMRGLATSIAEGIGRMARVTITEAIGAAASSETPTAISAKAHAQGLALHHTDESNLLQISDSIFLGSGSARASVGESKGGIVVQANIASVTAIFKSD